MTLPVVENHELAGEPALPAPGSDFVEVSVRGQAYIVGAAILPFHVVNRNGSSYIFNVERVSAFKLPPEQASRLHAYCDIGARIPKADFEFMRECGLVAAPSDVVLAPRNAYSERYRGCVNTLVLNVIQACNLRCTYCFAGDGTYGNAGRMTFETAVSAIDWYLGQHTHSFLQVNFFGGEPLANFALVRRAAEYVEDSAKAAGKQVTFSMTTNATLVTLEMARYLADKRFRIAVSIDGPRHINDRNRPLSSGKGSHDRIVSGIKLLQEFNNNLTARCTVHEQTDMKEVRDFLASIGIRQIHVAKATLANGRGNAEAFSAVIENARLEGEEVAAAGRDGHHLVNCVSKLADAIRNHRRSPRACGIGDKIASVGIDGGIYACHRFTNDKQWKIGDLAGGPDPGRFVDVPVDVIRKCRSCWAKYLCGGGCRHDNFSATGDPFMAPDDFCEEMKAYAQEAVVAVCESPGRKIISIGTSLENVK